MTLSELAEMHAASFSSAPRPWSAAEIESILKPDNCKLFERSKGFAVFRFVGPEAELLTIAVHPSFRRSGIAKALMLDGHESAKLAGVEEVFLEVSAENHAAQSLYAEFGYKIKALRKKYYIGPSGQKINGLVMSLTL